MARSKPPARRKKLPFYRDRQDYLMHLAVELAELSAFDIVNSRNSDQPRDIAKASEADASEAREILKRAGIRTPDESAPAWHFDRVPGTRATKAA
jgi:hypothetical protein